MLSWKTSACNGISGPNSSELCRKDSLCALGALFAFFSVLFPLRAQTAQPIWDVQDVREVIEAVGTVTSTISPSGDVYIGGSPNSYDWPPPTNTIGDVSTGGFLVAKLDSFGRPIYATAIGGGRGHLTLDAAGNLFVNGLANAGSFETTPGAYRTAAPSVYGNDFVCKLRAADGVVLFCALLDTDGSGIFAVDSAGFLYFAGNPRYTYQNPTPGAFSFGRGAIYVTKLDPAASTVLWRAAFSGSNGLDSPSSLAVDGQGGVWVAGTADTYDFPTTPDALIPTLPDTSQAYPQAGYLARLNSSGTALLYASYTGAEESLTRMVLDSAGNVYTSSVNSNGATVRKFSSTGSSMLYERSVPGILSAGLEIAVDENGLIAGLGYTQNVNFPAYRPAQNCHFTESGDLTDGVLIRIGPDGELLEATFLEVSALSDFFSAQAAEGFIVIWPDPGRSNPDAPPPVGPRHMLLLQIGPDPGAGDGLTLACLGSAATLIGAPLAPGEIVSLFGHGLGPQKPAIAGLGADGRFPASLAGTAVTFDGVPAPLLYTSDGQINAVVPWMLSGYLATKVCVTFQGIKSNCILAGYQNVAPGMFQLPSGYAAVINQDGTINSPQNPARSGSTIYVYATGLGPLSPVPADGSVVQFPLPAQTYPVEAFFMRDLVSLAGQVLHSGPAPLEVAGLFQIDVKVPDLPIQNLTSSWTITLRVDLPDGSGALSQALPIAVAP